MELATREGISVTQLQLKMVSPLPEADLREFFNSVEKVIVAELNFSGQVNAQIRSKFLLPTISMTKCEGLPFYAEEVLEKLRAVAGHRADALVDDGLAPRK